MDSVCKGDSITSYRTDSSVSELSAFGASRLAGVNTEGGFETQVRQGDVCGPKEILLSFHLGGRGKLLLLVDEG